jgi:hypothetical protein
MEINKKLEICHRTTIDTTRATYTTVSCVGQKRTFDEAQGRTDTNHRVFTDITNGVDFRQPAVQEDWYPPLKAARIIDIAHGAIRSIRKGGRLL